MKLHLAIPAFAALTFMLAGSASAVLIPIEDNWVRKGQANTVQGSGGTSENILIKKSGGSTNRKIWMMFDDPGAKDQTLLLTVASTLAYQATVEIYALHSGVTGFNWSESSITWNNAPGNNISGQNTIAAETSSVGSISGVWVTGTVFSANLGNLAPYTQSDGTVTLIAIMTALNNGSGVPAFYSSEDTGGRGPLLTPEGGSTLAMLGLVITGLAGVRRRRA